MNQNPRYTALLVNWLTPVYDLLARIFIPELIFKRELMRRAHLASGHRVIDLGAGTGTLAIMIKKACPDLKVTGIDGDPEILSIARKKAARSGLEISFTSGNVVALPYPDRSFDRVLSTLVLSLLSREEKLLTVKEGYRVLMGGGELHIADFGAPHTGWGCLVAPVVRRFEPIRDNLDGKLPSMFQEAGFENVDEVARFATAFGTLSIVSGQKPV